MALVRMAAMPASATTPAAAVTAAMPAIPGVPISSRPMSGRGS